MVLLEVPAHPVIRRRAQRAAADAPADQVGRLRDALRLVEIDEAEAETAMQEHRDRGEVVAPTVLLHHVRAAVELVDVARVALRHLVVDRARAGIVGDGELDTLGLHRAVLQGAHDLVVADHHRELQLSRHGYSGLIPTALTIPAVYSISRRIVAMSSSGVLVATGKPMSSAFARTSGELSIRTISSCRRTTMARGMPAGPKYPPQVEGG